MTAVTKSSGSNVVGSKLESDAYKGTVLVAEDDLALRDAISETLELCGYTVFAFNGAEKAINYLRGQDVDIVFSDVCMGDMDGHSFLEWVQQKKSYIPFVLMTAYGTIERSVDAMRNGAADYLVKPFQPKALIELVDRFVGGKISADSLVVEDPAMRAVYELGSRVAKTDSTIIISGESGTGKEVLAKYIHAQSTRSQAPFVAINCAAIPETMLEATLFGHEKGAFTGAYAAAPGKFELANGGTLLLDEISEMDLGLQAKLLRVIQEREVERVGGRKTIDLDVRILATTNRNLRREVEAGRFREDLFYRLSVFPLAIPALRQRPQDILPLASYLLQHHAQRMNRSGIKLEQAAIEKLNAHTWPGNVRELDNVMQRALILALGQSVSASELLLDFDIDQTAMAASGEVCEPPSFAGSQFGDRQATSGRVHEGHIAESSERLGSSIDVLDEEARPISAHLNDELRHHEVEQIKEALAQTRGSKKDAADLLGLSPRTLRYRMAKLREQGLLE